VKQQTNALRAYIIINIIFAGVILLIMGYSGFYSPDENKYPVVCIHEKLTGEPCPSCGLSHAFSLILRGRVDEAVQWNSAALQVFFFFVLQLTMRIGIGIRCLLTERHLKMMAIVDTIVSSLMALTAFYPFLRMLFIMILR